MDVTDGGEDCGAVGPVKEDRLLRRLLGIESSMGISHPYGPFNNNSNNNSNDSNNRC